MALKDTWKDLEDAVDGVAGSGDDISVGPINDIAHAVIENEEAIDDLKKNGGGSASIAVDDIMSSISTNPVQNKVLKEYIDEADIKLDHKISSVNGIAGNALAIVEEAKEIIGDIETLLGGI